MYFVLISVFGYERDIGIIVFDYWLIKDEDGRII